MKLQRLKKGITVTVLALALLFGGGSILQNTAQAQHRGGGGHFQSGRGWNNGGGWNRGFNQNRFGGFPRSRVFIRPRVYAFPRVYSYPRVYPYYYPSTSFSYNYYGNSYGRSYAGEDQRGYSDGLDRGQEDARDGLSYDPNHSSHFRSGNAAYRQGFSRGYSVGYRQYARW
jgi:hypothetical protein